MALSRVFSFDDPSACQRFFLLPMSSCFPRRKEIFHADDYANRHERDLDAPNPRVTCQRSILSRSKPGRRSIGFLTECNSSPLLDCGLDVWSGDIVMNRSDVVHQRSDADFHYGTVSLPIR